MLSIILQVVGVIGVIGTLVGVPLSYHFGRKGRRRPVLRHAIDHDVILHTERHLGLDRGLAFDGKDIAVLSRTNVAVWNSVGDTINFSASALDTDPWRISFPESTQILGVRLLAWSRDSCLIKPAINGSDVLLTFDYLDEGDGAVIEVLCDAVAPGALRGAGRGVEMSAPKGGVSLTPRALAMVEQTPRQRVGKKKQRRILRLSFLPFAAIGVFLIAVAAGILDGLTESGSEAPSQVLANDPWFFALFAGLLALQGVGLYLYATRWIVRRIVPKSIVANKMWVRDSAGT